MRKRSPYRKPRDPRVASRTPNAATELETARDIVGFVGTTSAEVVDDAPQSATVESMTAEPRPVPFDHELGAPLAQPHAAFSNAPQHVERAPIVERETAPLISAPKRERTSNGRHGRANAPAAPLESPAAATREAALDLAALAQRTLRRWPIVAGATLLCALFAFALAAARPKTFRATSVAAVVPVSLTDATDALRSVDTLERRTVVGTIAALAQTPQMMKVSGAGEGVSIETRVIPNTSLFEIEVRGRDAARTAAIANALPQHLAAQAQSLYKVYAVVNVSAASAPQDAIAPRPGRSLLSGLVVGLVLGLALAVLLDRARPGV